jgi:outer membrane protein assembly factor BamB
MPLLRSPLAAIASLFLLPLAFQALAQQKAAKSAPVAGWIDWRGPARNGTSPETGLPDKIDPKAPLWTADFPGQSSPVVFKGRLYINGYLGEGPDLREGVSCFDAETGKLLWQKLFNDFLSDTIYLRYATSAPAIDPETGNVYVQGTQGLLTCFTGDGKQLWQHSLMEEYGRLTFPNSRTATPVIDQDLVITRGITSGWGANGPAGDRFFAFDKKTGELVWLSWPSERPQDNTFSHPLLTWLDGQRVLMSAAGDSSIVCLNARTGDPIFRFPAAKAGAKGGINAAMVRCTSKGKDALIVIHESENIDTSEVGRSAAYQIPKGSKPPAPGKPQVYDPKDLELWRNPTGNLASSPAIAGERAYFVSGVGELISIDLGTGKILWREKLGVEQRQSSPLYADGKLYIAFYTAAQGEGGEEAAGGGRGEFFIIKPADKGPEILSRAILEGRCYGTPLAYNGKVYVQTDKQLYAFGKPGENPGAKAVVWPDEWKDAPNPGKAEKLQIIPNEVLLHPGEKAAVRVRSLDAAGLVVEEKVDAKQVKFAGYIPPTALVKASMKGAFNAQGELVADPAPVGSAGAFQGVLKAGGREISGTMRARVLPSLPFKVDFSGFELTETTGPGLGQEPPAQLPAGAQPGPANWNVIEPPTKFAYPPLYWNGARFRFDVRQAPGEGSTLALNKTIDNKLFQRGQVFIGHPGMKNYTIQADVMSEGNRRKLSDVGLINQRYLVVLRGNAREIEISSNLERLRVVAPYALTANEWHRLKVRVDTAPDGSGVVRAKAWKKAEPEPDAWTIVAPHQTAHAQGSPGFFSLTPQEQRAWIDNITVTPN